MALANTIVWFDLHQLLGADFDPRRTKAYVTTNVENDTLIDTSTGEIRMGDQAATINADGTGEFTTWGPGTDGNPTSWQTLLHVDYARTGQRDRKTRTFGPYTIDHTYRTVTNKALTSNVATLTLDTPHGLRVGDNVVVSAVDATFNGSYTITAVPTTTTLSYAKTAANVAAVASTGLIASDYASLALLEDEQAIPPTYETTLTARLDAHEATLETDLTGFANTQVAAAETARTGAEAARTGAETARTGAEAARDEAVDISNISTSDGVITAVDANAASAFRVQQDARLSATYGRKNVIDLRDWVDFDPTGANSSQSAVAAAFAQAGEGDVILSPAGIVVLTDPLELKQGVTFTTHKANGSPITSVSDATVLWHQPTTPGDFIKTPAGSAYLYNVGLQGFAIKGSATSGVGADFRGLAYSNLSDLWFTGFTKNMRIENALVLDLNRVRSTEARETCLHIAGPLLNTTLTAKQLYLGQGNGVAGVRPLVMDKDCLLGGKLQVIMESTRLGASIGAGNVVEWEAYTENISSTSEAVAVFEIGKTGAPAVAADGGIHTFVGGTLAGSNAGVHAASAIIDVDYCHALTFLGTRFARAADAVLSTANTKKITAIGTSDVQVTRGVGENTAITRVGNYSGSYGVRVFDSYAGALTATAVIDVASIPANSATFATITVPGAAVGDAVLLGPPSGIEAGLLWSGRVSAANTVNIRLYNFTASAVDPGSATWRATVVRAPTQ